MDFTPDFTPTEILADKKSFIESSIIKRNTEREDEILKERANREKTGKENVGDCVEEFYKNFNPLVAGLEIDIDRSTALDKTDLPNHLDQIVKKIQEAQKYVADSAFFLPSYDKKKAQGAIDEINDKFQTKQDEVLPKKKFGFKGKKQKVVAKATDVVDTVDKAVINKVFSPVNDFAVRNKAGERVELENCDVGQKDVNLADLKDSTIIIRGQPSTLHMSNIRNCTILTGPVSTSVFIEECQDSTLVVSCQQLRTHNTYNSQFYIHVTSKAIIEDCKDVSFAPYTWEYPNQEEDFKAAGLDRTTNNWDQVADFNWLATDKPSPNWTILPEDLRRTDFNSL